MQFESVKHIAQYYKAIPGMLRLLQQEREELEDNYYGLRGLAYDGTPHSSSPGKPTEEAGLRALESGVGDRLAEIKANEMVLSADAAAIRGCLDAVNGRYKQVILMRYVRGYSWAKTGVRMNAPDSTVRNWHERAMERFGEALEELPGAAELAARQLESVKDQFVRLTAEYDNYRKRSTREADQKFNDGVSHAVNQILAILDTLDMAANAPTTDENYKKGVVMTLDKAAKALEALHVEEIEVLGKPFDPNFMNAVQQIPAPDGQESGTVVTVFQKGYKLGDKIIRHATVVVAE